MRARLAICGIVGSLVAVTGSGSLLAAGSGFDFDATPGRLPKTVVPIEYHIALTANIAALKINGTESVRLRVRTATDTIVFNTLDISISDVRVDGVPVSAVNTENDQQLTTLRLPALLRPGTHWLTLNYQARLQTVARGMFLQPYELASGLRGQLLSTQLEAAHARRLFPCWDEPAFRARFMLSLTAPANWSAVSNMPAMRRTVSGDRATTQFRSTPPMASYLVVLTTGDLGAIQTSVDGTQLGVWTIRGQERDGLEALLNARQILADFNRYLGVRFPLPKLDAIAVPGGWGGAMENWGAITYTEQSLLVGPTTSEGSRQGVFSTQAHEMAHQWFGDLVTPAWWNDAWLNESFASLLSARETAARHPDWSWNEQQFARRQSAMEADVRPSAHAIDREIGDDRVADAAFDQAITYGKGQSILQMLESYLGAEVFRAGLRRHLKAHAYSNATGADLWAALSAASHVDVGALARPWIARPGYPLIFVASACDAAGQRTVTLMQQRFLLTGAETDAVPWQVPLAIRIGGEVALKRLLLGPQGATLNAGRCGQPLNLNADAIGYYRVAYDAATLAANIAAIGTLSNMERLALLDDQWALVIAGQQSLAAYLALVSAMQPVSQGLAWRQVIRAFDALERALRGTPMHEHFLAYGLSLLEPIAARLSWETRVDETASESILRRQVLQLLADWGSAAVRDEALQRCRRFLGDHKSLSADDQELVLGSAARVADAARFEELLQLARSAGTSAEQRHYYLALANVLDPALAARVAQLAVSSEIPPQSRRVAFLLVQRLAIEHPQLAWQTFTAHHELLLESSAANAASTLASAVPSTFWDAAPAEDIERWLRQQVPTAAAYLVDSGMEGLRFKLRERQVLRAAAAAMMD